MRGVVAILSIKNMTIPNKVKDCITGAEGKALASSGPAGLNVVPVSIVRVNDNSIWLFNFFMDKTIQNVNAGGDVALACWSKLCGMQIKATTQYVTEGAKFEEAVAWVATQNPDRVVLGLLELTPTDCYDVTADPELAGTKIPL